MEAQGMTQAELSRQVRATPGAVSRWIAGARRPSLGKAILLEQVLGLAHTMWTPEGATPSPGDSSLDVEDTSLHGRGAA
jgi:transcriptional regulator with XRE-family HTH domain